MNLDDRSFLRDLGYRIREHRQARNWTQEELADKCGLHRTHVGAVERGQRSIDLLNLRTIARVLRVPLAELLDGLS